MRRLHLSKFFLIAGPCVIESRQGALQIAQALGHLSRSYSLPVIFKASYDKANRSSHQSYRGLGMGKGLEVLKEVGEKTGLPLLTDVHTVSEVEKAAEVVDVLQIPAFLSRQTDLLQAAGKTRKWVNVKKGQFLAPQDMRNVVEKLKAVGAKGKILLTERGTTFGYHNLVVDFRGIPIMKEFGCPVIFDGTHSVQRPGGLGNQSGGDAKFIPALVKAAVVTGCDGLFLETHPNPSRALSDGPNMISLKQLPQLLEKVLELRLWVEHSEKLKNPCNSKVKRK